MAVEIVELRPSKREIIVFFAFVTVGQALLLAFFLTILIFRTRTVRRDGSLLNLCVALFIWSIGADLLLFAGHFTPNYIPHEPANWNICMAQAVIIYGSITMGAASVFGLVMHLWFSVFQPTSDMIKPPWWRSFVLVYLQWLVGIFMAIISIPWSLKNKDRLVLRRNGLYCSGGSPIGTVSSALCGVFVILALGFQAHLAYAVFRSRSGRRSRLRLPRDFIIRMTLYSVYSLLTVIAAILLIFSHTMVPFIFMGTLPFVVFSLFATGPDILSIWFCLNRKDSSERLGSHAGSTELSDRAQKDGGPTTYLTSPFDMTSGTAWNNDQITRNGHDSKPFA